MPKTKCENANQHPTLANQNLTCIACGTTPTQTHNTQPCPNRRKHGTYSAQGITCQCGRKPRRTAKPPGRTTVFTPENQAKIIELLQDGNTLTATLATVGIDPSTWSKKQTNVNAEPDKDPTLFKFFTAEVPKAREDRLRRAQNIIANGLRAEEPEVRLGTAKWIAKYELDRQKVTDGQKIVHSGSMHHDVEIGPSKAWREAVKKDPKAVKTLEAIMAKVAIQKATPQEA